jgi:hypothetical protein
VIYLVSHAGSSLPQSSIFTLNCWVLLEDADRVFPVDIAKEKPVGTLKKEIKKEKKKEKMQRLRDIDGFCSYPCRRADSLEGEFTNSVEYVAA